MENGYSDNLNVLATMSQVTQEVAKKVLGGEVGKSIDGNPITREVTHQLVMSKVQGMVVDKVGAL